MKEDMESSFRLRSEREIMRRQEEKSSRNMKRIIDKTYHVDAQKLKVCSTHPPSLSRPSSHLDRKFTFSFAFPSPFFCRNRCIGTSK